VHCLFFRSSTAFTVCAPYCSVDSSGLLVLSLVNDFPDGLRADLLSGWQCIAGSSARQWLSWFACCFVWWMTMYCSFFRSSMAFTVCALFCSVDNCALLILPLVQGFHHGLRSILLSGWQRIAHSSTRQRIAHISPSQRLS